jgi:hypothetical protein
MTFPLIRAATRVAGPAEDAEGSIPTVAKLDAATQTGLRFLAATSILLMIAVAQQSARAADGLDVTLPPSTLPVAAVSDPQPVDSGGVAGVISAWEAMVAQARATQPTWSSPLVTTTAMLEQRLRFDLSQQHSGNGTNTTDLDGGKGLDLIVTPTTEIQIAAPPYIIRSGEPGTGPKNKGAIEPIAGFNDWAFFRVTQRLASSPESEGNYVVSALLQIQAPSGIERLTSNSWEYLPTLGFGKGWGAFDIQGTVGGVIPASHANIIGYQVQTNVAFQYHIMPCFWPELEVNWTYYANGQRGGLNQIYLTPGLVVGRFSLSDQLKFTFGVGYQAAVTPTYIAKPLTPAYNHAWLFTTRLNF